MVPDPNLEITRIIARKQPAMVARFGSVELRLLVQLSKGLSRNSNMSNSQLAQKGIDSFRWPTFRKNQFQQRMDYRPENATRFLQEYEAAMAEVDLLAAWSFGESYFSDRLTSARICRLNDLQPWLSSTPWSAALAGKKVVVVHPFKETIYQQFSENRAALFEDQNVLPQFDLRIVQAFMPGVRDYRNPGQHFFEKIDVLVNEIHQEPFDVAIIGSGPNGFLLAAEVKRRGGIALHLGGITQLLFGIRGKRWEDFGFSFFNDNWVRPLPADTPPDYAEHYDKGAYW